MTVYLRDSELAGCRSSWLAGMCPCCGSEICGWEWNGAVHEPQAIAEDVLLCGRCAGNQHLNDPELRTAVLIALVP
jgi:hypothetical protein